MVVMGNLRRALTSALAALVTALALMLAIGPATTSGTAHAITLEGCQGRSYSGTSNSRHPCVFLIQKFMNDVKFIRIALRQPTHLWPYGWPNLVVDSHYGGQTTAAVGSFNIAYVGGHHFGVALNWIVGEMAQECRIMRVAYGYPGANCG